MTDETANLILAYMHRFERTIGDMREELHGVNRRPSNLEQGQALINRLTAVSTGWTSR